MTWPKVIASVIGVVCGLGFLFWMGHLSQKQDEENRSNMSD